MSELISSVCMLLYAVTACGIATYFTWNHWREERDFRESMKRYD